MGGNFNNNNHHDNVCLICNAASGHVQSNPHTFHIPVMGTGFTIDTPLRVAKYGITSVISIGDDILMEKMRKFHSRIFKRPYRAISGREDDARARRITAYLNQIDEIVAEQAENMQKLPFGPTNDLARYFDLLPEGGIKRLYKTMQDSKNPQEKAVFQEMLRCHIVFGKIDVNIMTKLDRDMYRNGEKLAPEYALAMSALRGYARSKLRSSIVLSAGVNRRLFAYMAAFDDFFPTESGLPRKQIILKVSDFRSAALQGKLLARHGLWVSEYRIESGLNCGGHAFATKGLLMGPIIEEFLQNRDKLTMELFEDYQKALSSLGRYCPSSMPVQLTAQGGVGTNAEHRFLLNYFHLNSVGWGSPFLLVPEATNVDAGHLRKLIAADENDISLTDCSPLGIPFWNLRTSDSEKIRLDRIQQGRPGSPCPKGYLGTETEFSDLPLCRASRKYQEKRLAKLDKEEISPEKRNLIYDRVISRSCICLDLAGGAELKNALTSTAKTAVCCGPGILGFKRVSTLEEMTDHIYGRGNLLSGAPRAHMFITELRLYVEYLLKELKKVKIGLLDRTTKYFTEFRQNLLEGIDYYQKLASKLDAGEREKFLQELVAVKSELLSIMFEPVSTEPAVAMAGLGRQVSARFLK
ncbi:MAG: hypothetical protein AB1746_02570 [Candidatus Zixiibacteriota bacterium]